MSNILKFFKYVLSELNQNMCRHAFTLSETLITLGLVGVVAAVTLPTLITNCQKLVSRVRIQKAYAILSQTTYMAEAEHGPVSTWTYSTGNTWETAQEFAETYMTPYLRVMRKCEKNSTNPNCTYQIYGLDGKKHDSNISPPGKTYRFYLVDGTFVSVWAMNRNISTNTRAHSMQVTIFYDIDGPKGHNKMGHDVFKLEYIIQSTKPNQEWYGKIYPAYMDTNDRNYLLSNRNEMCNKNQDGTACLALIMRDGWKISPDYPW